MHQAMKLVAVAGSIAFVASACGSGSSSFGDKSLTNIAGESSITVPADAVKPAGSGDATCAASTTLAYIGAETGDNAQLGINIYNGVQLAIDQHNEANANCQVKFKKYDTEGSPDSAPGPVSQAVSEKDIIGVIGLPFSGESDATGKTFEQEGLVHITPSATLPALSTRGWTTFFRGLGNDNVQGPAVAALAKKLGAKSVYVVQDDSPYGVGLAETTKAGLGDMLVGSDKVTTKQKDFSATISKIKSEDPDVVFYSGYYAEGAPLDQQLVSKGFKGAFIGPDGVKDAAFIEQAGDASSNAYFTCPCLPGELVPDFSTAYKAVAGGDEPGTYSLEAYDAATILLAGIDGGNDTRAKLKTFVAGYDGQGFSKPFKWDATGELADKTTYGYKVENGKIVSIGVIG